MPALEQTIGSELYLVEGLSLDDPLQTARYALQKNVLASYVERRQLSYLAQFYTLVTDGLILTRHCFQGLRRDLYDRGQENGHLQKYALVRKPAYDYEWAGGRQGRPEQRIAPPGQVFVVLISKNTHKADHPTIEGWIDRWSWVEEDTGLLQETPVGWVDRYESKVWTRKNLGEAA